MASLRQRLMNTVKDIPTHAPVHSLPGVDLPGVSSTLIPTTTEPSLLHSVSLAAHTQHNAAAASAIHSDNHVDKFATTTFGITDYTDFTTQAAYTTMDSHHNAKVTDHPTPLHLGMHEIVSITFVVLFVLVTAAIAVCYYSYKKCACCKSCRKDTSTIPKSISKVDLDDVFVVARAAENHVETAADLNSDDDDEIYSQKVMTRVKTRTRM